VRRGRNFPALQGWAGTAGHSCELLRGRGYSPAGGEVPEGAGWAGWRNRTDRVFEALFPAPPAAGAAVARP
jgi:hypothetical protein